MFFLFGLKRRYFVLPTLSVSLLAANLLDMRFISIWALVNKLSIRLWCKKMFVSSAYIIASDLFKHLLKLLTWIKNKIGPKIEPCGTPCLILQASES